MNLSIRVIEGDWGGALSADVTAVVKSVAQCFEEAVLERPVEAILVEPTSSISDPPITLYERTANGEVRVLLSVRGNLWARLAFQFAHEFCHVQSNYNPPPHHSSRWIDESLGETSSLFALRAMAASWRLRPPYPNWASYASNLTDYFEERRDEPGHQLPAGVAFRQWLSTQLPLLHDDSLRRADNTLVALRLLPVFEEDADAWRAVRYLNLWDAAQDLSVEDFCAHWRGTVPPPLCSMVNRIECRLTCE
jgi:hypothetical protein